MNNPQNNKPEYQTILRQAPGYHTANITRLDPLAGDASGRQYFRAFIQEAPQNSVIIMKLHGGAGPLGPQSFGLTQDDTFVEMALFFEKNNIPAPRLLVDARAEHTAIVEDVGDVALWHIALGLDTPGKENIISKLGADPITQSYQQALELISNLQAIPADPNCIAFRRTLSLEKYLSEASEFTEFYAVPHGITGSALSALEQFLKHICNCVFNHPRALSHFDYMSHNIYVGSDGKVRIIDFQDASLNSYVRDVVALLNDRDIDIALGKERQKKLLDHYIFKCSKIDPKLFYQHYDEYLLHWNFRVVGRFIQLCEKRQMTKYKQWIPGTLRRLGRTLARASGRVEGAKEVLNLLLKTQNNEDIAFGARDPW